MSDRRARCGAWRSNTRVGEPRQDSDNGDPVSAEVCRRIVHGGKVDGHPRTGHLRLVRPDTPAEDVCLVGQHRANRHLYRLSTSRHDGARAPSRPRRARSRHHPRRPIPAARSPTQAPSASPRSRSTNAVSPPCDISREPSSVSRSSATSASTSRTIPRRRHLLASEAADGEVGLAAFLDREVGHAATVLHDRRVPTTTGNIDHLVVASTGIWVIDAKNYFGKVECRNVGERQTPEPRLFVAHRNQTKLVASMTERANGRRAGARTDRLLERSDPGLPLFHPSRLAVPPQAVVDRRVWIGWPQVLIKTLRVTPMLERSAVATLADHLGRSSRRRTERTVAARLATWPPAGRHHGHPEVPLRYGDSYRLPPICEHRRSETTNECQQHGSLICCGACGRPGSAVS